jgi:NADPH2:quinone reductase
MRAVIINDFGPATNHGIGVVDDPCPNPDQVVVTVKAVAANFVDILVMEGKYQFLPERPFTPGKLPAGTVSAIGSGVTGFRIGDRVLAMAEHGGYAEKVLVDARECYKLPAPMSFVDAAAIALVYDTSWVALHERARIKAGDSVLVLGSTGGIGLAAIQLAKAANSRTLAAVSRPDKADLVRDAGADEIIDLSRNNLRDSLREQVYAKNDGIGADIVIDPIGGDVFNAALRAVAWRGRYVIVGFAAGQIPTVKVNYLLLKNIELSGLQVSDYRKRMPELMKECFRDIFAMYEIGKIKPGPTTTYPIEKFATALQDIQQRRIRGRAVLIPDF